MTAFYMFRLMAMTFFGALSRSGLGDGTPPRRRRCRATARRIRRDPHAHGQAHRPSHEVSHGPAEPHGAARRRTMQADTAMGRGTGRTNRRRR